MAHITHLPFEILSDIYQRAVNSTLADPAPAAQEQSGGQPPPFKREQQARREVRTRVQYSLTSGLFYTLNKVDLSRAQNAELGCLVTKNTICYLAKLDDKCFAQGAKALLQNNLNVEVDFSSLSEKQTSIVLKLLFQQAKKEPLHNLRFTVDASRQSPKMLRKINAAITLIRRTESGAHTAVEFSCISRDKNLTTAPDLRRLTNLTSLDLSRCGRLATTLDFSNNPQLEIVKLRGCRRLPATPNFSNNPRLTELNLALCEGMDTAPDLSNKPLLKYVNLSGLRLSPAALAELRALLGDKLRLM